MFNDLVWKSEPEYVNLLIVVTSVVLQAIFTAIIINYLKSKPPATKTVMDVVNIVYLSWLLAVGRAIFLGHNQSP